ncbi:MAG: peptidoglycan-binding protein, partial [Pseudomonadota bacterium]
MTLIARMSFLFCAVGLSASAQTGLPIPNGTYAVDSSLCEATGFTEFQQGRPSVIEVEGTAYFYNEAACEMQNLRVFGDDIIFDANCSTEGEASLARDIWVRTGAESFRAGVLEYHRCRAADAANATSQDGQLAVTDGDSVYSLQISLLRLGYDPGPADGQIGQRTISALNMFQRSVGMAVTPYITLEAAKRATEEEAKRFGWDIDSAGGNAEIETQDLFENDVAADQANEQAGVQGEAQPGALPDDLPQTLRFAIS